MLTGEYDYLTPPEPGPNTPNYKSGKWTASQIPGAEFLEMEAIGHFPMSETYPVFKPYLQQAPQVIEQRLGTPARTAESSEAAGAGAE